MTYADNQGTKIYYEVHGDGPPLVLLSGMLGSVASMHEFGYIDAVKEEYKIIAIDKAEVTVKAEHDGISGNIAEKISFTPSVTARASEEEILELISITNKFAEIPNTLRVANKVQLKRSEAISNLGTWKD